MSQEDFKNYLKSNFPQTSSFLSGLMFFITDFFVLIVCNAIGFFIVNFFASDLINFKSFSNYTIFFPLFMITFLCIGLYPGIMITHTDEVKKFCLGNFFSTFAIILSIITSKQNDNLISKTIIKDSHVIPLIIAFYISFIISIILHPGFREFTRRFFCRFSWWGVPAVIYTTNGNADLILKRLTKNKFLGYHPAVIIDSAFAEDEIQFYDGKIPIISDKSKLIDEIYSYVIKTAFLVNYEPDNNSIMTNYRYTITVSKAQHSFTTSQEIKDIGGIIGFASIHNLTFKSNMFIKRLMDISLILLFLPLLLPVFLVLIVLTKITSKGPVFYGHKRIGKNNKEFKCWKFRSMCVDADKILEKILAENPAMKEEWEKERKFQNDPRITKFGKFLRKTSLDELPQLFNILIGQMSFVGPRPVTEPELDKYGEYRDYILSVTPGLSGMWQTSGRSDTEYEERIALDTYYIQNWSIWLDIWILIKTVWVVLKGSGAY